MKKNAFIFALIGLLALGACCSKKGACPVLQFDAVELVGFAKEDVASDVSFAIYQGGSSFTQLIDSQVVQANATSDTNVYRLNVQNLSADYDYVVIVSKLSKIYKINNYLGKKIACGKCFMRSNNQFGYELTGYSVNNRAQEYEGSIRINK